MEQHRQTLPGRQRGTAAVEYALYSILFFTLLFGVIEVARAMFLWNTMYAVTSRAARSAAMVNFNDSAAKATLRQDAMFLASASDKMMLTPDIGYEHLKIDYLQKDGATGVSPMPPCPAKNMAVCMSDPNSPGCIHFVRVRLCRPDSATDCDNVPYSPLLPLPGLDSLNMNMPWFSAVVPVETLGMPGACT